MKRLLCLILAAALALASQAGAEEACFSAPLTHAVGRTHETWMADDAMTAMCASLLLCDLSLAGLYEAYDVVFRCAFERGTLWLVQKEECFGLLAVDESCELLLLFDPAAGEASYRLAEGGAGIDTAPLTAERLLASAGLEAMRPVDPFMMLSALMQVLDVLTAKAGLMQ